MKSPTIPLKPVLIIQFADFSAAKSATRLIGID
jgi:hypothetical protein